MDDSIKDPHEEGLDTSSVKEMPAGSFEEDLISKETEAPEIAVVADDDTEEPELSFEDTDELIDGAYDGFGETDEDEGGASGRSKNKKILIPVIIAAAAVLVIIAAYITICAAVNSSDTILKNTYVDGVSIGTLTVGEAALLLEEELSENTNDSFVLVEALGETYTVELGSILETDWQEAAQLGYDSGHGSFFSCGISWIRSFFTDIEIESVPYAAYEDLLYSVLEETGLTALTSVVESEWELSDDEVVITLGISGQTPDIDALCELILAAVEGGDLSSVIECPMSDDLPADIDLDAIYEEIYVEPENASLDSDNDYSVIDSVTGVSFDIDEAAEAIANASEGDTVSVSLVYTEPEVSTSDLESKLFADVLGTYTTSVSGSSSARKTNIKLASASCEVILLPGETFSFNDIVGDTTAEKGYQLGASYVNGAVVNTLGGGICQVSSTLYVACIYANLEITERHNHSYTVSYLPLGWDATVSYGTLDFQFTNNTNYPIQIVAEYSSDNKLTMSILGTDETGYTVKIVSETYSTTAYSTTTIEDDTLEEGTTVVDQSGYTGYTVQTWRYVYDSDGNLISDNKEAYSSYKTRNKIVRVGTKSSDDEDEEEKTTTAADSSDEETEEETTTAADSSE